MLTPGQPVPDLELPLTIDARFHLSRQEPENYTMLVFYRGKHCPVCKRYLEEIGGRLEDFTSRGVNAFAISMDSEDRAMVVDSDWETHDLPLVHSLTEDQARQWGLYISGKREGSEEPKIFSEPALFLVKPNMSLHFSVVQSAPFTRPPLDELLQGIDYTLDNDYPTRGTLT
ncbi:redoxin domain-containing protein [Aurantiacibacter marinus]|uniref:Alkyl hydroperoxide reductase n=1 Tax=Aurantiacibacter marinus TaxID=874156 RepID=A0A0H0XPE4_9SPHN|nr:redoxin domain-containing protein [Aurantiacibacter marinus]KLI63866.1 alkyl hydroperoxide reductase [Aurantiacibacter marinus]